MILELPDYFLNQTPEETIWRYAEFGIFIILVIFGCYFFWLYVKAKRDNPIQAPFNIGYTIFFSVQAVNQVFYIADAFSSAFNTYLGHGIELYLWDEPLYNLDFQLSYMFLFFDISFFFILFPFEKYIKQSKKYPVSVILFLSIVMAGVVLIFGNLYPDVGMSGNEALMYTLGIMHPIAALIIILAFVVSIIGALALYFALARQTSGELRKKALATAIGLLIWFLSVIVGNAMVTQLAGLGIPFASLIGPSLFYAGTFILAYGFQRK
nr:hypothetical protein [Candidatus Sigynarchaeota archaeon]